ncbi:MAG: hypothetical protein A2747_02320 [Candidatus Yonathbacteria bacterium RIFCSPHIGHO2_01_FULL_44_41]|uniref:Uncharacterized protein n=1 Tax=Candidatus Yonathbacteria bacterium RIFCSPHIGHO2_02_FULL_44_14 TaxID=1802724 RepID=A0A1G2S8R2_9BACT|nr:MAG: hypothetical protein A2747_02320 [Candidatus Yonathbacteria bacterium RIFCSPHIGHO2_01_FULL_44_41]OHA81397.1 MAG: hypothetical protein A3D51_03235 [Candidatus Yonathbacteria bacterium RIFCSPHIGHO2_02_FULL_44_14]OHA82059.1 MAG: hypothetical protein A3B06_00920 [Candidatus Yonathbacteria bacterium RIFCSPLOWO2_01_FULL_43_20]
MLFMKRSFKLILVVKDYVGVPYVQDKILLNLNRTRPIFKRESDLKLLLQNPNERRIYCI